MVDIKSRKYRTEGRRLEWQALKRRSTVHGTHRTGWSTSKARIVELKVVARSCRLEWLTQEQRSTVLSTPDYDAVLKETGREMLAHDTPGGKPLALNIQSLILFSSRQTLRRVLAGTLVREHDTQKLRLRL